MLAVASQDAAAAHGAHSAAVSGDPEVAGPVPGGTQQAAHRVPAELHPLAGLEPHDDDGHRVQQSRCVRVL